MPLVGKYIELQDAYKSIYESLYHAGAQNGLNVKIKYVSSELAEDKMREELKGQEFVRATPEEPLYALLDSFNQMYGFVFRYMVREVGPIAENVLEKYLGGLREAGVEVVEVKPELKAEGSR